ncbi:MATE family efflux transporter [Fulvitalea axinellae]|uniref:MATE family efflux transporter n=1 Tax=Fulvitalea axinellae TaxID=1182444 RepID=UPI0030CA1FFD
MKNNNVENESVIYRMVKLALPIMGMSVFQLVYNFTDMVWVGKIGSPAVTAIGTVGFLIGMCLAIASMVNSGTGVKVSHAVGAEDRRLAGEYITVGMAGMALIGLASAAGLYLFPDELIGFFGLRDQSVVEMAYGYLSLALWGIPLSLSNILFTSAFNSHGLTKVSFKINVVGTVLNLLLDPLLIFQFGMGVKGAALATVLSHGIVFLGFVFRVANKKEVPFCGYGNLLGKVPAILKLGVPIGVQRITFMSVSVLLAKIIVEWGDTGIAVQKIGVQLEALTYMAIWGLMSAISILIGQSYGAKDFGKVRETYVAGLKLAGVISFFSSAMFIIFPGFLFRIFVSEPESVAMGADYLRILGVSQLFMSVEYTSAGAFNALGKSYINATVSVIFTVARLPLAIFLSQNMGWGLNGVWWSISISSIVKGTTLLILFFNELKRIEKKGSASAEPATVSL